MTKRSHTKKKKSVTKQTIPDFEDNKSIGHRNYLREEILHHKSK